MHVQCARLATLDASITVLFQNKSWTKSAKICTFRLAGLNFTAYLTCVHVCAFSQLFLYASIG